MQTVSEIMTKNLLCIEAGATLCDCAKMMRDNHVGAIIVEQNGDPCGIVTDRDITVRGVAQNADPRTTQVADICSTRLLAVSPQDAVEVAIATMRNKALRRLLVVEAGKAVGIVSLGDLAQARDRASVLGRISAAPPNR